MIPDRIGFVLVAGAVLYGAYEWSPYSLVLGGLTVLAYGCMVVPTGLGGRAGAAVLIPLMALFSLVYAMESDMIILSCVVAAGSVRSGMMLYGAPTGRDCT